MELKHIVGLIALSILTGGGLVLTTMSQRLRDVAFFLLVASAVITHGITINLFGQYWYRGTSRGLELGFVDALAFCVLVSNWIAPRYTGRRWIWPAGLAVMIVYFIYCCVSVGGGDPKIMGVWELGKILRGIFVLLAAAGYVRTRRELAVLVLALACTVVDETLFGFKQRYMRGMFRVQGTLDHENSLSMYLCTVAPVLMAAALANWWRILRWFAGAAAVAATLTEVMTLSRAGIPIFFFVMGGTLLACTSWKITRRKLAIGLLIVMGAGLVVFKSWDMMAQRFESASLSEEYLDDQAEGRGVYWRWAFAIVEDHPWGVGLNNWSHAVSKTYGPRLGFWYEDYDEIKNAPEKADLPSINYAAPAHSLAALTMGELGIPGLIVFTLIWLRWFQVGASFLRGRLDPDPLHRMGIGFFFATWGIFLQSTTEWTYRQTVLMFTFHIMMGALASLHFMKRHARAEAKKRAVEDDGGSEDDEIEIEVEEIPAAR